MFKRYWLFILLPILLFSFSSVLTSSAATPGDNGLPCANGPDFRSRMQGPWDPDRFDSDPVGIRYSPRWDIFYYAQCLDPATPGVLQAVLDKVIADGKITKDGCNGGKNIAFDSQGNLKLCSDEADSYVGIRGSGASAVWLVAYYDATNPPAGGSEFPTQPVSSPPTQGLPTDLGQLIQQIFTWSLGILGISVFVMFFYSGFLWLTAAGNTAKIGEAKTHMTNAVFGAILLLSSYLILYTINPDFVKNTVNLPGLGTTSPEGTSGGGTQISCESPEVESPDPMPIMQEVRSESLYSNLDLKDKTPGGGREKFTAEVAKRLNEIDSNWGRKKSSSSAPISTDSLGYLRSDVEGSGRFEAIDTITSSGTLYRGCWGVVDSGQVWVTP